MFNITMNNNKLERLKEKTELNYKIQKMQLEIKIRK